jgi:hypothetical protein
MCGLTILLNIEVQEKFFSASRFRVEIILVNAGPEYRHNPYRTFYMYPLHNSSTKHVIN